VKKLLFVAVSMAVLMFCVTSPGWGGGLGDAGAGLTASRRGDLDEAIRLYTKAIDSGELSDENVVVIYTNRGNIFLRKGDYKRAIKDYSKAIKLNSLYVRAYNNRSWAWVNRGRYDEALADCSMAIDLNPQYLPAFINCGVAWERKGEYDRAIAHYSKAIELNPQYALSYSNRGAAWKNKGDHERAMADYNKAIEVAPDFALAYRNRGDILYNQARFIEAIADYKKAIEKDYKPRDYPYLGLLRALSKVSMEDYNRYLEEFRNFVNSHETEEWIRTVSRYYLGMDTVTEKDVLAEARRGKDEQKRQERLCEAYYYLGEQRLLREDRKGAEEFFRKGIETNVHFLPEYSASQAVLRLMGEGRL
jgi:tetratricopeptide (TPR) repeat protein